MRTGSPGGRGDQENPKPRSTETATGAPPGGLPTPGFDPGRLIRMAAGRGYVVNALPHLSVCSGAGREVTGQRFVEHMAVT